MTAQEAIERLEGLFIPAESPRNDALSLAITALRAQAEKERRYVVKKDSVRGTWYVWDQKELIAKAYGITTEAAAQAIADIYEGMEQ